jgi:hypothetical protein
LVSGSRRSLVFVPQSAAVPAANTVNELNAQ